MKIIPQLLIFFLFVSCINNQNDRTPSSVNNTEISLPGEIITSLLKPEIFRNLYGPIWVLMDGGSDLASLLDKYDDISLADLQMTKIPDARGKFLRMNNNGASCKGIRDCDFDQENTVLGDFQPSQTKSHYHLDGYDDTALQGKFGKEDTGRRAGRYPHSPDASASGTASSKTSSFGGKENRPNNISVNFYVKVASCPVAFLGPCR